MSVNRETVVLRTCDHVKQTVDAVRSCDTVCREKGLNTTEYGHKNSAREFPGAAASSEALSVSLKRFSSFLLRITHPGKYRAVNVYETLRVYAARYYYLQNVNPKRFENCKLPYRLRRFTPNCDENIYYLKVLLVTYLLLRSWESTNGPYDNKPCMVLGIKLYED